MKQCIQYISCLGNYENKLTLTVRRFITAVWTLSCTIAVNSTSQAQTHSTLELAIGPRTGTCI